MFLAPNFLELKITAGRSDVGIISYNRMLPTGTPPVGAEDLVTAHYYGSNHKPSFPPPMNNYEAMKEFPIDGFYVNKAGPGFLTFKTSSDALKDQFLHAYYNINNPNTPSVNIFGSVKDPKGNAVGSLRMYGEMSIQTEICDCVDSNVYMKHTITIGDGSNHFAMCDCSFSGESLHVFMGTDMLLQPTYEATKSYHLSTHTDYEVITFPGATVLRTPAGNKLAEQKVSQVYLGWLEQKKHTYLSGQPKPVSS